jgi:hypothetical protein
MSFTALILVAITFTVILMFHKRSKSSYKIGGFSVKTEILLMVFLLFFYLISISTLMSYLSPKNPDVFDNTDYHYLEHRGFAFSDSLRLVNSDDPANALFDSRYGLLTLKEVGNGYTLSGTDIWFPVFIKEPQQRSFFQRQVLDRITGYSNKFSLANPESCVEISDSVTFRLKEGELSLKVIEYRNDSSQYVFNWQGEEFRSRFKRNIYRGYPFDEILNQIPRLANAPMLSAYFAGSYLIREDIEHPDKFLDPKKEGNHKSKLLFVPGQALIFTSENQILINGQVFNFSPHFSKHVPEGSSFLMGIGKTSSDVFNIFQKDDRTYLNYNFYKRFKISRINEKPGELCERFLTSDQNYINNYNPKADDNATAGYSFANQFNEENNINHFHAIIQYIPGSANNELNFKIFDNNFKRLDKRVQEFKMKNSSDEFLLNSRNSESELEWVFSLRNTVLSNEINHKHIIILLTFFFVFFVFRVLYFWSDNEKRVTRIEVLIFMTFFILLLFRSFLIWRTSTFFDPSIDFNDYNAVVNRSGTYFQRTFIFTVAFSFLWFLRFIDREVILSRINSFNKIKYISQFLTTKLKQNRFSGKKWYVYLSKFENLPIIFLFSWILLLIIGFFGVINQRIAYIFIPVVGYFIIGYWIAKQKFKTKYPINILQLILALGVFSYLLMLDAGYSIMFGVFLLIKFLLRKVNLLYLNGEQVKTFDWKKFLSRKKVAVFLISAVMFLLIFLLLKYHSAIIYYFIFPNIQAIIYVLYSLANIFILVNVAYNPDLRILRKHLGAFIIISGLFLLFLIFKLDVFLHGTFDFVFDSVFFAVLILLLVISIISFYIKEKSVRTGIWLTAMILLLFVVKFEASNKIENFDNKFSYLKYRVGIIEEPIDKLILETNFQSGEMRRILNAVHNQFLINYFISPDEEKTSFFYLKEHFKQGATHRTQLADLVIPRYVIAEHRITLLYGLIILLVLCVFVFYYSYRGKFNTSKTAEPYFVLLGIPLLIFTSSFFVWLTATNRFTFFGQDFPMLSVNSQLTIILTITLILILIYSIKPEDEEDKFFSDKLSSFSWLSNVWGLIIIITTFTIFLILDDKSQEFLKKDDFNLNQLIDKSKTEILDINKDFQKYQRSIEQDQIKLQYFGLDSLLIKFYNSDYQLQNRGNFINSAFQRFVFDQTNKRNPNEFIHARWRDGLYTLHINNSYFVIKSPKSHRNQWIGNVLASNKAKIAEFIFSKNNSFITSPKINTELISRLKRNFGIDNEFENIKITTLPKELFKDNAPITILKVKDGGRTNVTSSKIIITNLDETITNEKLDDSNEIISTNNTLAILPGDQIVFYNQDTTGSNNELRINYNEKENKYLSKGIWLNNRKRFYFPLGEKFMWSYNFTNLISDYYTEHNISENQYSSTIDYQLTNQVYDYVNTKASSISPIYERILTRFRNSSYNQKYSRNFEGIQLGQPENHSDSKKKCRLIVSKNPSDELSKIIEAINKELLNDANYFESQLQNDVRIDEIELNRIINDKINHFIGRKYDFAMVGMDGDGNVRLIADYSKIPKANPNNIEEYYSFLNNIFQSSTNLLERDYLSNNALVFVPKGVGSSFKPIAYAATTSKAKIDWESIELKLYESPDFSNAVQRDENSDNVSISHYLGKRLYRKWNITGNDLWSGTKIKDYLYKSNNLFHSLVISLGSYRPFDLKDQINSLSNYEITLGRSKILKPLRDVEFDERHLAFPSFSYKNMPVYLDYNNLPDMTTDHSALSVGLQENFDMITYNAQRSENYQDRYESLRGKDVEEIYTDDERIYSNFAYSFPEKSEFLMIDRRKADIRSQIIQPTLGGYPIMVTPFKMAEMSGKLFSMNTNYKATFSANEEPIQEGMLNISSSGWASNEELFNLYQKTIFNPMYRVFNEGGTFYNASFNQNKRRLEQDNNLYLYGKTGTIGDLDAKSDIRNKALTIVIANKALHNCTYDEFRDPELKLYAIYVIFIGIDATSHYTTTEYYYTDYRDGGGMWDLISFVLQSETFNDYLKR